MKTQNAVCVVCRKEVRFENEHLSWHIMRWLEETHRKLNIFSLKNWLRSLKKKLYFSLETFHLRLGSKELVSRHNSPVSPFFMGRKYSSEGRRGAGDLSTLRRQKWGTLVLHPSSWPSPVLYWPGGAGCSGSWTSWHGSTLSRLVCLSGGGMCVQGCTPSIQSSLVMLGSIWGCGWQANTVLLILFSIQLLFSSSFSFYFPQKDVFAGITLESKYKRREKLRGKMKLVLKITKSYRLLAAFNYTSNTWVYFPFLKWKFTTNIKVHPSHSFAPTLPIPTSVITVGRSICLFQGLFYNRCLIVCFYFGIKDSKMLNSKRLNNNLALKERHLVQPYVTLYGKQPRSLGLPCSMQSFGAPGWQWVTLRL